jgi:hypothetical protein
MWPELFTGHALALYFSSSSVEINWPLTISWFLSFLVQCALFRPEHSCDIIWLTKTCVVSRSSQGDIASTSTRGILNFWVMRSSSHWFFILISTNLTLKRAVFLVVMPCGSERSHWLLLVSCLNYFSPWRWRYVPLKWQSLQNTQCYSPEDCTLHNQQCENHKSKISFTLNSVDINTVLLAARISWQTVVWQFITCKEQS